MKWLHKNFLGALLLSLTVFTHANTAPISKELIQLINASSQPVEENTRYAEMQRDLEENLNNEDTSYISLDEHPLELNPEDGEEFSNNYSTVISAYYSTTHRAAYHQIINMSASGDDVELEDQSVWHIIGWDASKIKKWHPKHTIIIAPNTNIFTRWSYPYKFINLDTHEVVKTKMKLTPVLNDPNVDIFVHWIEDIDYSSRLIRLEDGSLWSIPWGDRHVLSHFDRYNIVIVGTNDGWFRGSNPNLLICVKNSQYVRGHVIN